MYEGNDARCEDILDAAVDARSVDVKERTPLSTQDEVLGAVDVTFTQAERLRAEEAVREGRHVDLTMSDEEEEGRRTRRGVMGLRTCWRRRRWRSPSE